MNSEPDYTITLDVLPPSINKYTGYRSGYRKRRDIVELAWVIKASMVDVPPAKGRRAVRATITFPTNRRRDRSNYCKVLDDAMVEAGLLVDDSPEWYDAELPILRHEAGVSSTLLEVWEAERANEG